MRIMVVFCLLIAHAAQGKICDQGPLFTGQVIAVVDFPEHCQVFIQFSRYQTSDGLSNRQNDQCKIRDDIAGYFGIFAEKSGQRKLRSTDSDNEWQNALFENSGENSLKKITNPCQLPVNSTVFGLLGRNQFKQVTFSKVQVL